MPKKITQNEVNEKVESLEYEWVSGEYKSSLSKLILKDNVGYMYETYMKIINNGCRPDFVSKFNPFSIENIKLWCEIKNKNFILLSNQYRTNNNNLIWKCTQEECMENFEASWSKIMSGRGCPYCSGKKVGVSNCLATKNPQLALDWHPSKNGDMTPYGVTIGSDKIVWWACEKGHEWEATISNRSSGKNCPFCYGNTKKTNEQFIEEVYELVKNEYEVLERYINAQTKLLIKHNICESEYKVTPHMFLNNGRRCPICNETKGEKRIRKWLDENQVFFVSQKEFEGLIGIGGGNLSYDFYLPIQNILIEYQGQFHDGSNGDITRLNLSKQQEHDKRKREYAENNKIVSLEIWYWDYDNIEKILNEKIIEGGNVY